MKYRIIKNIILLYPIPSKNIREGLEVVFKPSNYWKRKNKRLEPIMRTDIIKDQQEYELPKYFRVKSILEVNIK